VPLEADSRNGPYPAPLDDEPLECVIISKWCICTVRKADAAFASGAHLTAIHTGVSCIETYLRLEQDRRGALGGLNQQRGN